MRLRNWLLFVLVVFLWGSNWSMMKIGLKSVPPIAFVFQRFLVSVAALFPVAILFRKRMPRDSHTLVRLVLLCLIFVSIIIVQAIGLVRESSGIGAVLTYTQPLFVFWLAVPFLSEKITAFKLLGLIIGFFGVLILSWDRISALAFDSDLMMLLGAFLWAVAVVYYKKYLNHVDPFVTHFLQLSVGALPLAALSLLTNSFAFPGDIVYLWIVLYSSVGALAVGNIVWLRLLREEEATTLSGSTLIIPAVALIFGWQLLGETLITASLVGSSLTLGGVYLINLRRKR